MAQIVTIQVGKPQERDPEHPWTSAIFKDDVQGAVFVGKINLAGDAQADLQAHGGPDKAVLAYALAHYDYWRQDLPELPWVHGAFGENLTIEGQTEADVCLGDVYRIGEVRVQVSQPRSPCWKLARRWHQKDLTARVYNTGFTGWYLRVLDEGEIEPGMFLALEDRPNPEWTIRFTTEVMNDWKNKRELALEMASLKELALSWRMYLAQQLNG
ncbi:MAG: MOSC domain-containing protein [Anaerolineae bacterium]